MCGTSAQYAFLYCPYCGYKTALAAEQPFPNWRQLPGFRSKTPWKMIVVVIIYLWVLLAIVASLFTGM